MHSSGSFLKTVLERIRATANLPDVDGMFKDPFIISNSIMPAMHDVWARITMSSDKIIVMRFPLTLVAGQEYYVLPPIIQEIHRLAKLSTTESRIEWDWRPRHEMHPHGPGWRIEANTLAIRPLLIEDETCDIWFTPSWSVSPHYATDGTLTDVADGETSTVTLSASPALGLLDKREHAYVGFPYRYLTGAVWQERIIESYDAATRVATLRQPITGLSGSGTLSSITYEVAPHLDQAVWDAIAMLATVRVIAGRVTGVHAQQINMQFLTALKTARDTFSNHVTRTAKTFQRNTSDHPMYDTIEYRVGGWI